MKIVAPVMPRNFEEAQSIDISKYEDVNLIEWRADFLPKEDIVSVAPAIFEKFAGREIIFTLRTTLEGGNISLSDREYVDLIKEVSAIYNPDYIDFEYFSHQSVFHEMLDFPNLILSYHNFQETPENLMEAFSEMTKLAPRVVKIAVMPKSEQDVLDLMNYTRGFKALNPEQEFATMSMGKLGRISRLAGDVVGSSWTFVSLDQANAPGQVKLHDMKKIIAILESDS
ncbi:type I 3-dehydroquinate dehydratase [Streptococcus phocae subsp. phocae]